MSTGRKYERIGKDGIMHDKSFTLLVVADDAPAKLKVPAFKLTPTKWEPTEHDPMHGGGVLRAVIGHGGKFYYATVMKDKQGRFWYPTRWLH